MPSDEIKELYKSMDYADNALDERLTELESQLSELKDKYEGICEDYRHINDKLSEAKEDRADLLTQIDTDALKRAEEDQKLKSALLALIPIFHDNIANSAEVYAVLKMIHNSLKGWNY
jgi:chromosome segregation ATPase